MSTRRSTRATHGAREVLLGGVLWTFLLVAVLAAYTVPELGTWIYR
jgi:hypothetical protein